MQIPFNRASLAGNEIEYIREAIALGHCSGDGEFTRKCSAVLEQELGVRKILLTTSCTHALEMSALLLNTQPGDEVIVPSFTFPSTINAFVLRGAHPVFVDIRGDTFNLDESKLESLITARTKAIVAVHYAGVGCEMDAILDVAGRHGVAVVEDNAHGLFGEYRGRSLGSFGCLAAQSFHETKNLSCGEGGALIVNDPRYLDRAEIIREKGTNRASFFRGQVDKYSWMDLGSSYLPSDLLAAFLYAQIEARDEIQTRRKRVWQYYHDQLQELSHRFQVRLPFVPAHCEQPYHMFYLVLPSLVQRDALIAKLNAQSISCVFHYLPLHLSEMARKLKSRVDCPVSEEVSDRLVRLPFYSSLTEAEQSRVVTALYEFAEQELG